MNLKEILERDARMTGFLDGQRRSLRVCLFSRFGKIPPYIETALARAVEPEQLDHLAHLAVTVNTLREFMPNPEDVRAHSHSASEVATTNA